MGRLGKEQAHGLARPEFLNEHGMIYGATYASSAIVPDGTPPPTYANPVTDYTPSGRPGGRAPHVWLMRRGSGRAASMSSGERVSTIDLIGKRFTVLGSGAAWRAAAAGLTRPPLDAFVIGDELADPDGQWHATYGVEPGGAVLVRPDGYIAWRGRGPVADPAAALRSALSSLGLDVTAPRDHATHGRHP
jgi:hypothetical protein